VDVVLTPRMAPPSPKKEPSPDVVAVVKPPAIPFSLEASAALVEPSVASFSLEASAVRARMSNGTATAAGTAPGAKARAGEDIGRPEETFPTFYNS
jgi:hypothetical protein